MQELLRCVWVLIRCGDANFALAVKMGQKEFDVSPKKPQGSEVFVFNRWQKHKDKNIKIR